MQNKDNSTFFITSFNDRDEPIDFRAFLLNKKRTIIIDTTIDENIVSFVTASIQFLAEKSDDDICLYINSPGGHVSDGLAIYDAIKSCACDIVIVATGLAASMAAFLLASGTKGKRYATENTEIMIHQPIGSMGGQASDIKIHAEHILGTKAKLNNMLAEMTGQPIETIQQDTDRDTFMTAQQAITYGLIDHVGYPKI